MKIKKFSFILLLVMCLITNLFVLRLEVFADVPDARKVEAHFQSMSNPVGWDYVMSNVYYTVEDATGIPSSNFAGPVYYYTVDNTTFQSVSGGDLITLILNRGLGLVLQPERARAIISAFFSEIVNAKASSYVKGGLYDSKENFLGYALDNLNGLYYAVNPVEGGDITVPTEMTNTVYNYYNYYLLENPEELPYFNVHNDIPDSSLLANFTPQSYIQQVQNALGEFSNGHIFNISLYNYDLSQYAWSDGLVQNGTTGKFYAISSDILGVAIDTTSYDDFVVYYNIKDNFNSSSLLNSNKYFKYTVKDSSGNNASVSYYSIDSNGYSVTDTNSSFNTTLGKNNFTMSYPVFPYGADFTIYRSINIFNSINVTQTYSPSTYYSNSFNNYSTSNDNSITTSTTQISNSVTNNSSAYDSSSSSYYNYVDNGYVDNSSISQNTTTVINNYYGTDSGGNNGGGDDPDSPLDWSDLIDLLKNLFEAIGAVIVGIFEGLISMITKVLEAIANIVSSLGGFTDFLSFIFGFLPSPVPEVLAAGFSLCVLCAVIKFLRG